MKRSARSRIDGNGSERRRVAVIPSCRVSPRGSLASSTCTNCGSQLPSSRARREAFFRKSDGPRLSPRKRRTSPVEAPSSYPLMASVSSTRESFSSCLESSSEPRPPVKTTTRAAPARDGRSPAVRGTPKVVAIPRSRIMSERHFFKIIGRRGCGKPTTEMANNAGTQPTQEEGGSSQVLDHQHVRCTRANSRPVFC